MFYKTIKAIFKKIIIFILLCIPIGIGVLYFVPIPLNFLMPHINKKITAFLPQDDNFLVKDIYLSIDKNFHVALKLQDFKLLKTNQLILEAKSLYLALSLNGDMNITLDQPKLGILKPETQGSQKISYYLDLYKDKLLKLKVILTGIKIYDNIELSEATLKPIWKNENLVIDVEGKLLNNAAHFKGLVDFDKDIHITADVFDISESIFKLYNIPTLPSFNTNLTLETYLDDKFNINSLQFNAATTKPIKADKNLLNELNINSINLKGNCKTKCEIITFENLEITVDPFFIKAQGEYTNNILKGTFEGNEFPIESLSKLWPQTVAREARQWVLENLTEGTVSPYGKFTFDSALNLDAHFKVNNSQLKYKQHTIKNLSGEVHVNKTQTEFKTSKGEILNSNITQLEGIIFDYDDPKIKLNANVKGDVQDLIEISKNFSTADIEVQGLKGLAETNLSLEAFLNPKNTLAEQYSLYVKSYINQLSTITPIVTEKGTFEVILDKNILYAQGTTLAWNKYPLKVLAEHNINKNEQFVRLKSDLDWKELKKLEISVPDFLDGQCSIVGEFKGKEFKLNKEVYVDLKKTNISHPLYSKKAAENGKLVFILGDDLDQLKEYELTLPALYSKGEIKLNNNFKLINIKSNNTTLKKSTFNFLYDNTASKLSISGNALDLSALDLKAFKGGDNKADFIIEVAPKKLIMKNNQIITKPDIKVIISKGIFSSVEAQGKIGQDADFSLVLHYPEIGIRCEDAGSLAAAFDITDKIEGGALNIAGTFENEELTQWDGTLNIVNYHLKKAPIMANILSVVSISLGSIENIFNLFGDKGMRFDKLACPIKLEQGIANLKECFTSGPSMTITANGTVDFIQDKVNIRGSVIPESIINTAVNNIPIIGRIFKDKKDHAIIGASYKVEGPVENPQASSNPLSILAPGIFKEAF